VSTLVSPLSVVLTLVLVLSPVEPLLGDRDQSRLAATAHAALPDDPTDLWMVPTASDPVAKSAGQHTALSQAAKRYADGDFSEAMQLASRPALSKTPLAHYAAYYHGLSQLRLEQIPEARKTLKRLLDADPAGHLAAAATLAAGEAAEAAGDHAAALTLYEALAAEKGNATDEVLARLARSALATGDRKKAAQAYVRLYYEHPLTPAGAEAGTQLDGLKDLVTRSGWDADIGRAQILFGARRYAEARAAFAAVRPHVSGDNRELADLRIAECDFHLKNHAAAREGLRPYLDKASRRAEARFFFLSAIRELNDHGQYVALTQALVRDFPDSSWSEEALNNLGTHYILTNEDELAAAAFRELYQRFPSGARAERAAWKYGWWSYKTGDYKETIRVFESAAATFPRSDYRPSYLYWAGRSHARSGNPREGLTRMRLVHADYANSYYGRLAEGHLRTAGVFRTEDHATRAAGQAPAGSAAPLPNEAVVRHLLAAGLYDDAINELRFAQRVAGNSPRLEATLAWAYNQKGELRRGITLMRRAYPQFLADGGQQLPLELRQVIFPMAYWTSIRREATSRGLDPYLMAALIAQESTFDPKARSVANAWGLMQIVPATGRRIAQQLGIRRFQTSQLTDPETNIRIGMQYFSRLTKQFGGTHYALASYNAGENRVVRWKAERPNTDEDEFIDDIPFPETQNYVKRIMGTAEDYRLVYGRGSRR
jgi:soluble lytic murein transglycosylase